MNKILILIISSIIILSCNPQPEKNTVVAEVVNKPNFLFCIADDWSYPHAGAYGDKVVRTPNFNRVAKDGLLFMNAFTASPSCAPSRAAILTGQEMWRLEEGSVLFGALSNKFPVYTQILRDNNYEVGFTGKGYGPGDLERGGWAENPAGTAYQAVVAEVPEGIRGTDYSANFEQFLNQINGDKPFCFWYGASEPHRRYEYGIGAANGYNLEQIKVPEFLPDTEETRNDVADYYFEVEWFDKHLGRMLQLLEENGMLDNTVVVVTSDNGMPFPRAKSNLYNYGNQMPLAIRWGKSTTNPKVIHNPVSLTDIAPTFLDLAGIEHADAMTGQSLAPLLLGQVEEAPRDFVVTGLERHTIARPDNKGYPIRAIHTRDYTYIHNFEPDRWPAGGPDFDAWPQGIYGDVDGGASKSLFLDNPDQWKNLFKLAFGKRPQEEFYRTDSDPFQLNNLAESPEILKQKESLKKQLFDYLTATGDPRMEGLSPWDDYPFAGGEDWEN